MIHFTICIALLVILAALNLLAKYKNEGLSSFVKWATYGVIIVATLIIVFEITHGIIGMRCHVAKCGMSEQCGPGMHNDMGECKMMGSSNHNGCCKMHESMCRGMMEHGGMSCCGKCSESKSCGDKEDEDEDEGGMKSECHHGDSTMTKEIHKDIKMEKK